MLQRQINPLPPGVYWKAVSETKLPAFQMWVKLAGDGVQVLKTVKENDGLDASLRGFTWFLFETKRPLVLPDMFAYPNVAERDTERGDTIQEPPPEPGPLDGLTGAVVASTAKTVVTVGLVAVGLYALVRATR